LYLPIHKNGLYTMTPFISQIIFKNVLSWVSDWLKKEKQLDPTKMGKGFQIFSALGLITLIDFMNWPHKWTIALYTGAVLNIFSLVIFLLYGEVKIQSWAESSAVRSYRAATELQELA
ncbi:unnamed protein product, partial [Mesorhabditis spiculigera]